jgi:2'-5' RNA ligase
MIAKSNLNANGYQYNEYQIVLTPNDNICDNILMLKKEFTEKYKTSETYLKPQMLLVNFIHFQMIEERIVNHLKNISKEYNTFQVKLKNYGSFPSHTIFINVETKQQVQNLVTKLKCIQGLITMDKENKPHYIDDFYLTIARKLLPWQYEKAWLEYNHRHFTGSFVANGFVLLKRKVESSMNGFHPVGSYQVAHRFEFMNSPVMTKQGELFT